jgi:hypothetical protein
MSEELQQPTPEPSFADRLYTEAAVTLGKCNELGNYRLTAEHAALPMHERDLLAMQATLLGSLHQILSMRAKLQEIRDATQPD